MTGASPEIAREALSVSPVTAAQPFVIDMARTTILAAAADYRLAFQDLPVLMLKDVFAPPLLDRLMVRAETAHFVPHDVAKVGHREVADDGGVASALSVLLDRPILHHWLEQVTGLPPLRGVAGAFAQARAGSGDELDWHDDRIDPSRALGVVVNLTSRPYEGGRFEMRRKGATEPFFAHHHETPGTAVIFAIRPDLEHRVTPVTSGGPRRVFAGWFLAA